MVEPLKKPPRKNPLKKTPAPLTPPMPRSRAALRFTAYAAQGQLRLQKCADCGFWSYPPRDVCHKCWSDRLTWVEVSGQGRLLSDTTLHTSTNLYFRARMNWRIGTVKLDEGMTVLAHVHSDVQEGAGVRLIARTDKSGQGIMIALPQEETDNMADDKILRELTCDPKHRRVLITDGRGPLGQTLAQDLLLAGADKIFLGVSENWKPLQVPEPLRNDRNVEIVSLDVTDGNSVFELAGTLGDKVDILVNTAHQVRPGAPLSGHGLMSARDEMEINYFGLLRLLQAFGPTMRSRGADGDNNAVAWVNVMSVFALSNWPSHATNSASAAASLSLMQGARGEFAGSGIKLVDVFHGPLDDEWHDQVSPPKVSLAKLSEAVVSGLQKGLEHVIVGDVAKDIYARWEDDPATLLREITLAGIVD